MSQLFFVNLSTNGIRCHDTVIRHSMEDVQELFELEGHSGFVIQRDYNPDETFTSEYLGTFNGFKPSAQEGLNIQQYLGYMPLDVNMRMSI